VSSRYSTSALAEQQGNSLRSSFLLTECNEKPCSSGGTRLQLVLEDSDGSVLGFVWPERRGFIGAAPLFTPVEVLAEVKIFDGEPQLRVQQLNGLQPDDVDCASELLPLRRCPIDAHGALKRLIELERSLPEPLGGFLRRALLDPAIGIPLLRCRASVNHHHAQPGGLLLHCTSALDIAANLARWALPTDANAPAMAQLGYLLHDLGKLRSVGESSRSLHGLVIRHEIQSLLLLAPHLKWLESQDADLGAALQYILAYLATPAKSRPWGEYLVAELVASLDTWSAAGHNGRDMSALLGGHKAGAGNKPQGMPANDDHHEEARHVR
jgi:hypothetical protein